MSAGGAQTSIGVHGVNLYKGQNTNMGGTEGKEVQKGKEEYIGIMVCC